MENCALLKGIIPLLSNAIPYDWYIKLLKLCAYHKLALYFGDQMYHS